MSYCVYCHTNIVNGKRYIGITCRKPEYRWRKGKGYYNNCAFSKAIEKYGWDGFLHEVLYEGLTLKEAEQKEIELISAYKCCNPKYGYNIEKGGNSSYKYTDEVKRKISDALKGKAKSDVHKKHLSESRIGIKLSEEVKEKMSQRMSGAGNPMYGRKRDISQYKTKKVFCVEKDVCYNSTCEASRETGIQQSDISKACNGKLKTAGHFHWQFV